VDSMIEPSLELGEERNGLLLSFALPLLIAPILILRSMRNSSR
jgi:hypothetical protein